MRRCECGELRVGKCCPSCDALRKPAARGRLHREGLREPSRDKLISTREASRGMANAGVPMSPLGLPRYVRRGG